jgi:Zn-dependent protease with chaperone function
MHLVMILSILAIALGIRSNINPPKANWRERWQFALLRFLFPPLLLLTTAIALVLMGSQGTMMGLPSGWFSYGIGLGFCVYSIGVFVNIFWQSFQTIAQISALPWHQLGSQIGSQTIRLWNTEQIFAAQIGFWAPQLVVSSGLIQKFDQQHLEAVLKHEEAHLIYRDTFWFFCFGYFRQITFWLPQTEILWQELLLLREIRADRWASKSISSLVLAESLLWSVSSISGFSPAISTSMISATLGQFADRLEERIENLLAEPTVEDLDGIELSKFSLALLALTCFPFASIFLHS